MHVYSAVLVAASAIYLAAARPSTNHEQALAGTDTVAMYPPMTNPPVHCERVACGSIGGCCVGERLPHARDDNLISTSTHNHTTGTGHTVDVTPNVSTVKKRGKGRGGGGGRPKMRPGRPGGGGGGGSGSKGGRLNLRSRGGGGISSVSRIAQLQNLISTVVEGIPPTLQEVLGMLCTPGFGVTAGIATIDAVFDAGRCAISPDSDYCIAYRLTLMIQIADSDVSCSYDDYDEAIEDAVEESKQAMHAQQEFVALEEKARSNPDDQKAQKEMIKAEKNAQKQAQQADKAMREVKEKADDAIKFTRDATKKFDEFFAEQQIKIEAKRWDDAGVRDAWDDFNDANNRAINANADLLAATKVIELRPDDADAKVNLDNRVKWFDEATRSAMVKQRDAFGRQREVETKNEADHKSKAESDAKTTKEQNEVIAKYESYEEEIKKKVEEKMKKHS